MINFRNPIYVLAGLLVGKINVTGDQHCYSTSCREPHLKFEPHKCSGPTHS